MKRRTVIMRIGALAALSIAGACRRDGAMTVEPVRVAAASDLALAFAALAPAFVRQSGHQVVFSFGSTGLLAKQIREGAPFDLFAAADASVIDDVVAAGACDGASKAPYGRGRVVLFTKKGSAVPPRALAELEDARFDRIAIANPEHAPYGRAARQALESAGLWQALASRIVFAENVRQALQFAKTGNVTVALVALALVVRDDQNSFLLVDESLHEPLEQALVECRNGKNRTGARAFARYLASREGRALMNHHGFFLPGEAEIPR